MSLINDLRNTLLDHQKKVDIKAESQLKKLRNKGRKYLSDTNKKLEVIVLDGEKFKEEITPESTSQQKYSLKIYEVVNSTIESISIPDNILNVTLKKFAEETRDALGKQDAMLIKYVSLLKDPIFKKRVKSLSNSLKRLNKELSKLENFILQTYSPQSSIEEMSIVIDELLSKLDLYEQKFEQLAEKKQLTEDKDSEISDLKAEILKLESNEIKVEYERVVDEYSRLQRELDNKFSNVRKAMRKYVNLLSKSKSGGDTTILKEFITDVASTFSKQSIGSITSMLSKLDEKMNKGALKLKKDKRESARADIRQFLDGELEKNWNLVNDLNNKRGELEAKLDKLELDSRISKLKSTLVATKRDRNRIIERELRDIRNFEEDIRKLFEELSNHESLSIDSDVQLLTLPEWANILE